MTGYTSCQWWRDSRRGRSGQGGMMEFEDLVTALKPPPNRVGKSDDLREHHLYEGAVMVAFTMHLLRTAGARHVRIHPDGEHGKQFDFTGWLRAPGIRKGFEPRQHGLWRRLSKPGRRDESPSTPNQALAMSFRRWGSSDIRPSARAGSSTRGTRAKCRACTGDFARTVGLLMATPSPGRQVAVVPSTDRHLAAG